MPRPSPYVGWRRWASQAILWVILAATVGLAALVNGRIDASKRVNLATPREWGDVTVRLPKGWAATESDHPAGVVAAVREPLPDGAGRELTIYRERVPTLLSPLEYLTTSRIVDADVRSGEAGGDAAGREQSMAPIKIAGNNGILLAVITADPADGEPRKTLTACTVLPSREAITVKLDGPGMIDKTDARLIEQVATSLTLRGGAHLLGDGAEVTFDDGTTLRAPAGMRPVADHDELVSTRYMLDDRRPLDWAAVEITPCIFDRHDGVIGAQWMFLAHDSRWLGAHVEELGPGRYKAELPEGARGLLPVVGYLSTDEKSHALLAIFHGMSRRTAEFDAMWAGIERSAHFPAGDYQALVRAGETAVARLRRAGLPSLLGDDRSDQWWRWSDDQAGQPVGWTHFSFDKPGSLTATRETRWRIEPGGVMYVTHNWLANDDLRGGVSVVTQKLAGFDGRAQPRTLIQQNVYASSGKISVQQIVKGQSLPQLQFIQAPNFVFGGWLPRLIARLADKPMLIRSDAVWGPPDSGAGAEGDLGTACQLVLLTPLPSPTTASTQSASDGERAFTLEVNGTGKRSRWVVAADGAVDRVEFPGGLRAQRTDRVTLRMSFDQNPRMSP